MQLAGKLLAILQPNSDKVDIHVNEINENWFDHEKTEIRSDTKSASLFASDLQ